MPGMWHIKPPMGILCQVANTSLKIFHSGVETVTGTGVGAPDLDSAPLLLESMRQLSARHGESVVKKIYHEAPEEQDPSNSNPEFTARVNRTVPHEKELSRYELPSLPRTSRSLPMVTNLAEKSHGFSHIILDDVAGVTFSSEYEMKYSQKDQMTRIFEDPKSVVDLGSYSERLAIPTLLTQANSAEPTPVTAIRGFLSSLQNSGVQIGGLGKNPDSFDVNIETTVDHIEIRFHAEKRDAIEMLTRHQFQLEAELRRGGVENFIIQYTEKNGQDGRRLPPNLPADTGGEAFEDLAVDGSMIRIDSNASLDRRV